VELSETPGGMHENTRVIVTFLGSGQAELQQKGINPEQAAELRARLAAFAADWDSPEMEAYDDCDSAKARLQTRCSSSSLVSALGFARC